MTTLLNIEDFHGLPLGHGRSPVLFRSLGSENDGRHVVQRNYCVPGAAMSGSRASRDSARDNMRLVAIALLLSAPANAELASAGAQDPESEVRTAIAGMNKAASDLDADRFMDWYWNSPSLTITFDGETMRGWQPVLDQQRKWWSDKQAGIRFLEQRPAEIVARDADVVTSVQWMTVGSGTEGARPAQLVITSVWKKLPEGWRIVLAHETLTP
ncbi:MAG: nuclear transport factor 2 family protein [Sphingobium sp.]